MVTRKLNEEERSQELEAQLSQGNHTSTNNDPQHLQKLFSKNFKHGFSFTLAAFRVLLIRGSMLQTCGLAQQHGMGADSACFPKKRLTHNLLFLITYKDCSIKSQVNLEPFPEMIYEWYFL